MIYQGDMHMSRRYRTLCAIILFLLGWVASASQSQTVTQTILSDLSDALLLYASNKRQTSDWGFQKVTRFYGLKLAEVDLTTTTLTDALLRDEAGVYYPTVYIDGTTLETSLSGTELQVLEEAIDAGGANLLISALRMDNSLAVRELTDGEILGSTNVLDSQRDYLISEALPEVTRELTGLTITYDAEQLDYTLTIDPNASHTQILVHSTDDEGELYPLYARYQNGSGSVFVVSNYADPYLEWNLLRENYAAERSGEVFKQEWFSHLVPMMMFVGFSAGDEAWHRDHDYANYLLCDPPLQEFYFDYAGILEQAIAHNFHFTLGLPPVAYTSSEQSVIDLFLEYPERLSLVQHGNNHDGYEFYKYTVDEDDPYPPRPLDEQEADIVEGCTRMEAHGQYTGIPYARVMIFPYNISPAETLTLLKQYNFQATINTQDFPLGGRRTRAWDSYMYPAELDYNNFAVISASEPEIAPYPFDLFIDRPVFLCGHVGFFNEGIGAFNPVADAVNGLYGKVEWRSLDYIMKHLYLEKTNDDGSIDVMFFGNLLIITNESATQRVYQVKREETLNVPIISVTVDDMPVDYTRIDNVLQVDLVIPTGASRELRIRYAPADRDFALSPSDVVFDVATGIITATVHNRASEAGPVTVGFFEGAPENGGRLLALVTAPRIEPGATTVVTATVGAVTQTAMTAAVDPYDVIVETDETNNTVRFASFRLYLPLVLAGQQVQSPALLHLKGPLDERSYMGCGAKSK